MTNFQPNDTFDSRYTLIERIGLGGFAEVWKAQRAGGFEQAIKIFTGVDESGIDLAKEEFERVFNLNHHRLLKAVDYGVYQQHPYLVMPLCVNGSAMKLVGKITEAELAKLMLDVSAALAFIHNKSILHSDIKPDNFLIDEENNFLLADFGISKQLKRTLIKSVQSNRATQKISQSKNSGTAPPAYRPPEVFNTNFENRTAIKASDIWALGVTLYELAAGELPFGEFGGLIQRQGAEIPNLPENRFSPELNHIIKWCMQSNPWERPTATQLEALATTYRDTQKWNIIISTEKEAIATEVPKAEKRNKKWLVFLLPCLLLLLGGGYFWQRTESSEPLQVAPILPMSPSDTFTTKTVMGKVADTANNPVAGATILVNGNNLGIITNQAGIFKIEAGISFPYELEVNYDNFESKTILVESAETDLSIALERKEVVPIVPFKKVIAKKQTKKSIIQKQKLDEPKNEPIIKKIPDEEVIASVPVPIPVKVEKTIQGHIRNTASNTVINGASIKIKGNKGINTNSNSAGFFKMTPEIDFPYQIEISHPKFETSVLTIKSAQSNLTISLQAKQEKKVTEVAVIPPDNEVAPAPVITPPPAELTSTVRFNFLEREIKKFLNQKTDLVLIPTTSINSKSHKKGEQVAFKFAKPIKYKGFTIIKKGMEMKGKILDKNASHIRILLTTTSLFNGKEIKFNLPIRKKKAEEWKLNTPYSYTIELRNIKAFENYIIALAKANKN